MEIKLTETEIKSIQNSLQILFNALENRADNLPNEVVNICDKLNIEILM